MVQKEVVDYLRNGRSGGFSDSVLRGKLKEGGYNDTEIDEAFSQLNSGVNDIFSESKSEKQTPSSSAGGVPWIKASGWIGGFLFFGLFLLGVLMLVYPDGFNSIISEKVIFLAIFIIGMSCMALFYSGFIKIGKTLREGKLGLGSWLLIVSFFLVLIVSVIGNSIGSVSFQIMFTILSMSLSIVFIVGVIGQFLFAFGLTKIRKEVKLAGAAGIANWIMLFVFLFFAVSFVVLSFSMINAISDLSTRSSNFGLTEVFVSLGNDSGVVLFFSVMFGAYYFMKCVVLVFDVLVLRNAGRMFEN
jgi:hypothetical protein